MKTRLTRTSAPLLLFSASLASCAGPSAREVPGPDGTPHQLVSCNYIESCYQDASKVCGGKYKIVNTTSELTGMYRTRDFQIMLLVKCEGASDSVAPNATPNTIPSPIPKPSPSKK